MSRFAIVFFLVIALVSCRDTPPPPTTVMEDMFSSMKKGDIEGMKKNITTEDVTLLNMAEQFMTNADPEGMKKIKERMTAELIEKAKNIQYQFVQEKIDGNKAIVEAKIIIKDTSQATGEKITNQTFELVKEDNSWKIALSKPGNEIFNSMKGNLGRRKGDLQKGVGQLKQMNPDSLKMMIRKGLEVLDSIKK